MSQDIADEVGPPHIYAQNIIVIHPGSMNVRIGRASDLNPHTELHAIARRRRPGGLVHKDNLLPPIVATDVESEVDNWRLQVSHMLQSCLMSDGRRRYATPPQQISAFNRRSQPDVEPLSPGSIIPKLDPQTNTIIGDQVLDLDPLEHFNIHMPMKRGDLNVHSGVGGSLVSVISHLESIWLWIIENRLQIPKSQLKNYRVVLIVPDIYNRSYLKELATLVCSMGFSAFFMVQDHVAATFGAGLGSACVVDCGHSKTSVSCVEDGISQPQTRVRLPYGGGDITQCLHWLLNKCGFPYKTCDPDRNPRDSVLLESIKHSACHVDLDRCGCTEKQFHVKQDDKAQTLTYTIQVADECMIAPLGLFVPELLGLTGPKPPVTQTKSSGHPSDPHDAEYLRETGRKSTKEREEGTVGSTVQSSAETQISCSMLAAQDEEYVDIDGPPVQTQESIEFSTITQLLGIDQAVLQSVQRCSSDEMKRKMYSSILIVGGGIKFNGISTWLHNKISLQVPFSYRTSEQTDIVMGCKEMDPTMTSWKGAAIMSCLESSHELWISTEEWTKYSVKILRERAPFLW